MNADFYTPSKKIKIDHLHSECDIKSQPLDHSYEDIKPNFQSPKKPVLKCNNCQTLFEDGVATSRTNAETNAVDIYLLCQECYKPHSEPEESEPESYHKDLPAETPLPSPPKLCPVPLIDFLCNLCYEQIPFKDFQAHANDHTDEGQYICWICSYHKRIKQFSSNFALIRHLALHYENPFQCNNCLQRFPFKELLDQHFKKSHPDLTVYACNSCPGIHLDLNIYLDHLKTIHGKNFDCKECEARFTNMTELQHHLRMKHTEDQELELKCTTCRKAFKSVEDLKLHMQIVHKEFQCKVCVSKFSTQMELDDHSKTHSPLKSETKTFSPGPSSPDAPVLKSEVPSPRKPKIELLKAESLEDSEPIAKFLTRKRGAPRCPSCSFYFKSKKHVEHCSASKRKCPFCPKLNSGKGMFYRHLVECHRTEYIGTKIGGKKQLLDFFWNKATHKEKKVPDVQPNRMIWISQACGSTITIKRTLPKDSSIKSGDSADTKPTIGPKSEENSCEDGSKESFEKISKKTSKSLKLVSQNSLGKKTKKSRKMSESSDKVDKCEENQKVCNENETLKSTEVSKKGRKIRSEENLQRKTSKSSDELVKSEESQTVCKENEPTEVVKKGRKIRLKKNLKSTTSEKSEPIEFVTCMPYNEPIDPTEEVFKKTRKIGSEETEEAHESIGPTEEVSEKTRKIGSEKAEETSSESMDPTEEISVGKISSEEAEETLCNKSNDPTEEVSKKTRTIRIPGKYLPEEYCCLAIHQCSRCPRKFKTPKALRIHESHHRKKLGLPFKAFEHPKNAFIQPRPLGPPFQCPKCPRSFASFHGLCLHGKAHREACPQCPETFSTVQWLNLHVKAEHSTDVKYVFVMGVDCNICGRDFETNAGLLDHLLIHNTTFLCHLCNDSYKSPVQLQEHLLQHNLGTELPTRKRKKTKLPDKKPNLDLVTM